MRVISGSARGRNLAGPRGMAIRPTTDMVKQALFSILGDVEGAAVLDLYAGSGALGIEALSRGAVRCVFVDQSPAACALVRKNLELTGLEGSVIKRTAQSALRDLAHAGEVFQLVILDPPYGTNVKFDLEAALKVLAPGAVVAVEHSVRDSVRAPPELTLDVHREYGDTALTVFVHSVTAVTQDPML